MYNLHTMNSFPFIVSRSLFVLVLLLPAAGCASSAARLTPDMTLERGLPLLGRLQKVRQLTEAEGTVVVIRDRHSTRPGFHRVRPQLRQVQMDNRRAVEFLVQKGFRLLGCEQAFGDLRELKHIQPQYELISGRMKHRIDLDEYSVFQPVRFQLLWGDRLAVWGVEDPELFAQDIEDFRSFVKARLMVRRNDISEERRAALQQELHQKHQRLKRNVQERGRRAAENLIAVMEQTGSDRAILLIGGAHVPAALDALLQRPLNLWVFQSSRYTSEKSLRR